jgi:hypothetical protein
MAAENFAGIDFDEIKEATALEVDEIKVLKLCFNLFDVKKQDFLGADDLVSDFFMFFELGWGWSSCYDPKCGHLYNGPLKLILHSSASQTKQLHYVPR